MAWLLHGLASASVLATISQHGDRWVTIASLIASGVTHFGKGSGIDPFAEAEILMGRMLARRQSSIASQKPASAPTQKDA